MRKDIITGVNKDIGVLILVRLKILMGVRNYVIRVINKGINATNSAIIAPIAYIQSNSHIF